MLRLTSLPTVCAAVPALVAVGFCGAVFGAAVFGSTPTFWQGGPLTLAEAAALRDQGEVARLIESGADPDGEYDLRPDVLAIDHATPLEAAVAARRAEIIDLLMREGATLTPAELREFLSKDFAKWQLPESWAFIDEVPRTSVGKFDKKVIRKWYADHEIEVEKVK